MLRKLNAGRGRSAAAAAARGGGFTYLIALFVIAAMSVALLAAGEVWHTAQKRDKEDQLLYIGGQFRRAIAAYNASGAGYPHRLEDLLKDPRFPVPRRYLRRIYPDPVTGRVEWGLLKSAGDTFIGVYSLSDEEPLKKANFNLVDQDFENKAKYSQWVFRPAAAGVVQGVPPSATTAAPSLTEPQPGTTRAQPPGILPPPAFGPPGMLK